MTAGETSTPLAEQVTDLLGRLDPTAVESLSPQGWVDLWNEELTLEEPLVDATAASADIGGYMEMAVTWEAIAELNEGLASVAAALLAQGPREGFDLDKLADDAENTRHYATFARAQSLLLASVHQRMVGNLEEAAETAESARGLFEQLADDDPSPLPESMVHVAEGYRLGALAGLEEMRLQLEDAALTYLQAKEAADAARTLALQDSGSSDEPPADLVAGLDTDIWSFDVAHRRALLNLAVSVGNFNDAAEHAEAIVGLSGPVLESEQLPGLLRNLIEQTVSFNVGVLAYVRAELAVDDQDWPSAESQLVLARNEWLRTVNIALSTGLPQARQLAETTQALSAQYVGSCRRRITRERLLHATITKLEDEKLALQAELYSLASRPTVTAEGSVNMNEQHAGGDIVGGDKTGGNKTTAGRDVIMGNKVTAGGDIDFSRVWQDHASEIDLAALAQDLKALRSSLESSETRDHDTEIAAVAAAELAASEGDGPEALRWLKSAGKWVLDHAMQIGATVATVAAKVALGV
jgi:hypothetical protein